MRARKIIGWLLGVGLIVGLYQKFLAGTSLLGADGAGPILLMGSLLLLIVFAVIRILRS